MKKYLMNSDQEKCIKWENKRAKNMWEMLLGLEALENNLLGQAFCFLLRNKKGVSW